MYKILQHLVFVLLVSLFSFNGLAQNEKVKSDEQAYIKVITERANKIVVGLGIKDSVKYKTVRTIISNQYQILNNHHEQKEAAIKVIKVKFKEDQAVLASNIKAVETDSERELNIIHKEYINRLSVSLNPDQITKVKDAMTYNVLPITYKAYQEMLPQLTAVQKEHILSLLTEAREHAMDGASSHAKHAWFGKYKGKINNYLSAEGIDMKKAGIEWQERIKAEKAANTKK